MTERFLEYGDVAALLNVKVETVRTFRKRAEQNRAAGVHREADLPEPDVMLGQSPGWRQETIERWMRGRENRALARRARPE